MQENGASEALDRRVGTRVIMALSVVAITSVWCLVLQQRPEELPATNPRRIILSTELQQQTETLAPVQELADENSELQLRFLQHNSSRSGKLVAAESESCEEANTRSRFLTERSVILAAGARRTGSTWEYAALVNIAKEFGVDYRAICLYDDEANPLGNFPAANLVDGKKSVILKTHLYDIRLDLMATFIFSSYRDLRDEFASLIRKNMRGCANSPEGIYRKCREILHSSYVHQRLWNKKAHYSFKYETFVENPREIVEDMMKVLNLNPEPFRITRVIKGIEADLHVERNHMLRDHTDPYFFVTADHISKDPSPMGYKRYLTSVQIECLNYHYHEWLETYGYEVDEIPASMPPDCWFEPIQPTPEKKKDETSAERKGAIVNRTGKASAPESPKAESTQV